MHYVLAKSLQYTGLLNHGVMSLYKRKVGRVEPATAPWIVMILLIAMLRNLIFDEVRELVSCFELEDGCCFVGELLVADEFTGHWTF